MIILAELLEVDPQVSKEICEKRAIKTRDKRFAHLQPGSRDPAGQWRWDFPTGRAIPDRQDFADGVDGGIPKSKSRAGSRVS